MGWKVENEVIRLSRLVDEATEHLQRLVDWGWGEGAPDRARSDWADARAFLNGEDLREARI